ncbi:dihydrofolate reductase family protein [Microbacterium gilvum]|uniref:Dihydrofolate reductase family protein n=1 Tax=Microbacterium gilvum TaxID=1336204 RepID=A0ABP8ZU85_9MICO
MSRVVCDVTVSLDGFVAGPEQSLEHPLGRGGEDLHRWQFAEGDEHRRERDAIVAARAFIMGRNMFGPVRGPWPDASWTGWWGDDPPYHGPVFVLTHHERPDLPRDGGTTFHFATSGITDALARARAAADGGDVAIAGGAATIAQFLEDDLVDELRLHVAPVLLGSGERLLDGVTEFRLVPVSARATPLVTHLVYGREAAGVAESLG